MAHAFLNHRYIAVDSEFRAVYSSNDLMEVNAKCEEFTIANGNTYHVLINHAIVKSKRVCGITTFKSGE